MTAPLARWTEKLAGGPQAVASDCPPLARIMGVGRQQQHQFRACEEHLRPDIAEQVFKGKNPREAKYLAASIKDADPSSHWNTTKYEVMRHVLMAKAESSESFCEIS